MNKAVLGPTSRPIGFFQAMAVLLLALTVIGFTPTFFLRPLFTAEPLPARFYFHGFFTTCWILVFLVQAFLISSGNVVWHRRNGVLAVAIGGGLVVSGLAILFFLAAGYPDNGWELGNASSVIWGNIASLVTFCIFVGTGVALRARPQTHKRMMLFATLSIMGPPLTRIGHFDAFRISDAFVVNDAIYGLGGVLLLYAVVLIHDLRVLGRPHATILWAVPLQFGLIVIAGLMVARTDFGQGLVLLLGQSAPGP